MLRFSPPYQQLETALLNAACNPLRATSANPFDRLGLRIRILLLVVLCHTSLVFCGPAPQTTPTNDSLMASFQKSPNTSGTESQESPAALDKLPPTRFPFASPADWVELTAKEIEDELGSISPDHDFLPEDHRETRRIQKLLDDLFAQIKTRFPERFQSETGHYHIPRPLIRIRESKAINASVIKLTVCRGGKILIEGSSNGLPPEDTQPLIAAIDVKGRQALYRRNQVSCVDRLSQPLSADELIHALEDDVAKDKRAWVKTADGLLLGAVGATTDLNRSQKISGLLHLTTTNIITITTGAIDQFADEQDLRYTLAHELGHYLYAHGSLIKSTYFYFYEQGPNNDRLSRPISSAYLEAPGSKAVKLPSFRTQPIEGQTLHSEMFPYFREAMKRLVQPSCSDPKVPCFSACKDLKNLSDKTNNLEAFGNFPQASLSPIALRYYWLYEKIFPTCMASIAIRDESGNPSFGSVSREEAQRTYWNADLQGKSTLWDLALEMNERITKKQFQQDAILEEALRSRIGYYTTEEEADNFALEWAINLGIPARKTFIYWINYVSSMRGREQDSQFSFGYSRCARYFLEYGDKIYQEAPLVPVGSYSDPHHSLCYRAFRTAKRLDARHHVRMNSEFIRDVFSRLEENPTKQDETPYSSDEQSSLNLHQAQRSFGF